MSPTGESQDEFRAIVGAYAGAGDESERARLESRLWARFGCEGTVLVTDMCGFSAATRQRGICHFLGLIERARAIVDGHVRRAGGRLVKFEVDNGFALFDEPDAAFDACRGIDAGWRHASPVTDGDIVLSLGLDHGRLLLVGGGEFFGDPVNTASKLAEDLAGRGEVLASRAVIERLRRQDDLVLDPRVARLSGIEIEYSRVEFLHQGTRR